jgi:hypothetical protein
MKRYSLILCLVLIFSLSGVANAQIVLGPPFGGGGLALEKIYQYGTLVNSTYKYIPNFVGNAIFVYYPTTYIYYFQEAVEFWLGPAIPPTFTSLDFTARLDGLTAVDGLGTGAMNVDLFDMGEDTEDSLLKVDDFDSINGNRIARRTHTIGGVPADFNNIDVTGAVRNDLFGAGQTDFSGFILKCPDAPAFTLAWFNSGAATLTINPGVPRFKCGGGGGGCFIANAAR